MQCTFGQHWILWQQNNFAFIGTKLVIGLKKRDGGGGAHNLWKTRVRHTTMIPALILVAHQSEKHPSTATSCHQAHWNQASPSPNSWKVGWVLPSATQASSFWPTDPVRTVDKTFSMIILNNGAPQGSVFSHPYTHNCVAKYQSNSTYKFAEDTTAVGRI